MPPAFGAFARFYFLSLKFFPLAPPFFSPSQHTSAANLTCSTTGQPYKCMVSAKQPACTPYAHYGFFGHFLGESDTNQSSSGQALHPRALNMEELGTSVGVLAFGSPGYLQLNQSLNLLYQLMLSTLSFLSFPLSHSGHYLSAAAMAYESTGNAAVKARADSIMATMAKVQGAFDAAGQVGFIFPYDVRSFQTLYAEAATGWVQTSKHACLATARMRSSGAWSWVVSSRLRIDTGCALSQGGGLSLPADLRTNDDVIAHPGLEAITRTTVHLYAYLSTSCTRCECTSK